MSNGKKFSLCEESELKKNPQTLSNFNLFSLALWYEVHSHFNLLKHKHLSKVPSPGIKHFSFLLPCINSLQGWLC